MVDTIERYAHCVLTLWRCGGGVWLCLQRQCDTLPWQTPCQIFCLLQQKDCPLRCSVRRWKWLQLLRLGRSLQTHRRLWWRLGPSSWGYPPTARPGCCFFCLPCLVHCCGRLLALRWRWRWADGSLLILCPTCCLCGGICRWGLGWRRMPLTCPWEWVVAAVMVRLIFSGAQTRLKHTQLTKIWYVLMSSPDVQFLNGSVKIISLSISTSTIMYWFPWYNLARNLPVWSVYIFCSLSLLRLDIWV